VTASYTQYTRKANLKGNERASHAPLRKILAACMLQRINGWIQVEIPLTQAAYRSGRSTAEQVLTQNNLCEKTMTSYNYECYITLFDMSKAFDTVDRKHLME